MSREKAYIAMRAEAFNGPTAADAMDELYEKHMRPITVPEASRAMAQEAKGANYKVQSIHELWFPHFCAPGIFFDYVSGIEKGMIAVISHVENPLWHPATFAKARQRRGDKGAVTIGGKDFKDQLDAEGHGTYVLFRQDLYDDHPDGSILIPIGRHLRFGHEEPVTEALFDGRDNAEEFADACVAMGLKSIRLLLPPPGEFSECGATEGYLFLMPGIGNLPPGQDYTIRIDNQPGGPTRFIGVEDR